MKIGIFDSGIGGLSVLHEAYHMLPEQNYIFYADVDHVPYGTKTPEEIIGYSDEITRFLLD
ncbi:MAG: glutamate racemase, partial [Butyrivibrio sp.]|nr:glutamate racemase [Butyrivibrio sp.]